MEPEQMQGDAGEPRIRRGSALDELQRDPSSRSTFLRMMGGGGAAVALGTLLAACGDDEDDDTSTGGATSTPAETATPGESADASGDIEIVNYALTLEYLEADFYKQVIDSGIVKDKATADIAKQFGETEQAHVDALITAVKGLGGTPVEAPKTAFESVLEGGLEKVLQAAADVENLGAAAYLGQAGAIQNKDILAAALSIHSVEARHAAALNQLIGRGFTADGGQGSIPDGAFAKPMDMAAVLEAVKPFIAA
jgi:rubrerythrin